MLTQCKYYTEQSVRLRHLWLQYTILVYYNKHFWKIHNKVQRLSTCSTMHISYVHTMEWLHDPVYCGRLQGNVLDMFIWHVHTFKMHIVLLCHSKNESWITRFVFCTTRNYTGTFCQLNHKYKAHWFIHWTTVIEHTLGTKFNILTKCTYTCWQTNRQSPLLLL